MPGSLEKTRVYYSLLPTIFIRIPFLQKDSCQANSVYKPYEYCIEIFSSIAVRTAYCILREVPVREYKELKSVLKYLVTSPKQRVS